MSLRFGALEIRRAFLALGVRRGALVFVSSDLRRPGLVRGVKSRDDLCAVYLETLLDILGPEGTVVVPTFTPYILRSDADFVWESSPSVTGIFAEHVRSRSGSLRSWHPLSSYCAIGRDRNLICGDGGLSNFGAGSPFSIMHDRDVLVLAIGLESGWAVGTPHLLETLHCLPYTYHKLLRNRTVMKGQPLPHQFRATVCYKHIAIEYDLRAWAGLVREAGHLRSTSLGNAWVHSAPYRISHEVASRQLLRNPYFMLSAPPKIEYGPVPFDPPSGVVAAEQNWEGIYLDRQRFVGWDAPPVEHDRREGPKE